jgi:hypothetical protein
MLWLVILGALSLLGAHGASKDSKDFGSSGGASVTLPIVIVPPPPMNTRCTLPFTLPCQLGS